jgi:DTW domain-containing protein YfiP
MRKPITGEHRCQGCRMQRALCICALVPRLATRTHLVLVLHQLEVGKPTNTGRLAVDCLPNSRIVIRGAGNAAVTWPDDATPVLLFPHEDAEPIERWRGSDRPVALVVPDGTWSQAIRVRRRVPGLAGVPAARLPDGMVSRYRLRHDPRPGHVSTLEAIAAALRVLETDGGDDLERRLLEIERIMVERTLWSAGKLRAPEVTGGIPEAAWELHREAGRRGGR